MHFAGLNGRVRSEAEIEVNVISRNSSAVHAHQAQT